MMRGLQHASRWRGGAPRLTMACCMGIVPLWRTDSRSSRHGHTGTRTIAAARRQTVVRYATEAALELENASSRPRPDGRTDTHVRGSRIGRRAAAAVVCAALTIVVSITHSSGASASVQRVGRHRHDTDHEHDHTDDEHEATVVSLIGAIKGLPVPTIALINGQCCAGALEAGRLLAERNLDEIAGADEDSPAATAA